jgi:hypothetical protein
MKKFFAFAFLILFSVAFSSPVSAAEAKAGNSVTSFFRRLFNYPVKATQETAQDAGTTLSNVGEKVVSKTGENTAAIVSGDLEKTGNLVADPVVGTAETVGQTVS